MITPGHGHWKEAGEMLSKVLARRPDLRSKLPALVNDSLLALSAQAIGATLYTRNRDDFIVLRNVRPFQLVVIA
jgi:predicted nucleic acid-binding protein